MLMQVQPWRSAIGGYSTLPRRYTCMLLVRASLQRRRAEIYNLRHRDERRAPRHDTRRPIYGLYPAKAKEKKNRIS